MNKIVLVLIVCLCLLSSSGAAAMMMGGEKKSVVATTTFIGSEIPKDAMVIDVGDIPMNKDFNAPAGSTATTRTYYLKFQRDGNLVWVKTGTGTQWAMGSVITMPNAKIYLQGDGNICARGKGTDLCMNSGGGARVPTHDGTVPTGQHKLVGTKEGLLYVDHGTGVAGRSVIFTPPTATETYVLPY